MKIAYICDCKDKCCKSMFCIVNGGPCSHTLNINHAKNYTETPIITENSKFVKISDDYSELKYFEEE